MHARILIEPGGAQPFHDPLFQGTTLPGGVLGFNIKVVGLVPQHGQEVIEKHHALPLADVDLAQLPPVHRRNSPGAPRRSLQGGIVLDYHLAVAA